MVAAEKTPLEVATILLSCHRRGRDYHRRSSNVSIIGKSLHKHTQSPCDVLTTQNFDCLVNNLQDIWVVPSSVSTFAYCFTLKRTDVCILITLLKRVYPGFTSSASVYIYICTIFALKNECATIG